MKRRWLWIALLAVAAGIQLIRPERTNPSVEPGQTLQAQLDLPPDAEAILRRSCYDCHSNETFWPWYSGIAPVSWLIARDVEEGRRSLNFSEWGTYKTGKVLSMLERICDETTFGEMPLSSYLVLHPSARLTAAEVQTLCDWAEQETRRIAGE